MKNGLFCKNIVLFGWICAIFGQNLSARELSLADGVFKSSKSTTKGDSASVSTLGASVRYSELWYKNYHWFIEPGIFVSNYDMPSGRRSPSSALDLKLMGGVRNYFLNFSQLILPFIGGEVGYLQTTGVDDSFTRELSTRGLFYGVHGGFRFLIDREIFFEIDIPVFRSPIYSVAKSRSLLEGDSGTDTEVTSNDLYIRSKNGLGSARFAIGLLL